MSKLMTYDVEEGTLLTYTSYFKKRLTENIQQQLIFWKHKKNSCIFTVSLFHDASCLP